MRNLKKLLVVICVLALLTASCVIAAFAADAGTVAELEALIATAETATDPVEKYNAVLGVKDYIKNGKIDKEEAGYDEAVAKAHVLTVSTASKLLVLVDVDGVTATVAYDYMIKADKLLELYELAEDVEGYADAKAKYDSALVRAVGVLNAQCDPEIETTLTTAVNHTCVAKAKRVLTECTPFGDESILTDLKAEFAALETAQRNAVEKNYRDLDDTNRISNYDLPIFFEENWESRNVGLDKSNLGSTWHVDDKGIANKFGIQLDADGNKYMVHQYREKMNPQSSYAQISLAAHDVTNKNGLVFEFDITTFGEFPDKGFHIETGSVGGAYFPPSYFRVDNQGNILSNENSGAHVIFENGIIPGQWTHVILILDPLDFVYNLYIEGQHIATYDAKYNGVTTYDHNKVAFRISGGTGSSGEMAIDNIQIYSGDNYRNHNRLTDMNRDEKFLFYVDYLVDENNAVSERSLSYTTAKTLLESYWVVDDNGNGSYTDYALANPEIKAAVDTYNAFDLDSFLYEVGIRTLDEYIDLVEDLAAIERKTNTSTTRTDMIAYINTYLTKNGDLINREIDQDGNGKADYFEYESIVNQVNREAGYDANSVDFIRYVNRFEAATTFSAKQRNYKAASELAENDGIDIALIMDESNPDRANFPELVEAFEKYRNADQMLYQLNKDNNSNKIVKCIEKINVFTTEEEWLANREIMEEYLYLLENIVLELDEYGTLQYNPDHAGVEDAVEFFNETYAFFFAIHQDEHVEYIQGMLDRVANTEAYIEKMGMVSSVEKYIDVNDIDHNDARIINLLNDLDTCKAELALREEDYAKILVQNAVYFVNLVERMRTAQTYNEQKQYFEEAHLLYFYIDVTVEGAAKAVEIFDEYKINLERIAESSVRFIEAVAIYKTCETEDDKYAALVECYYNAQFVEMSYDGAEEAMAEYLEAYNTYMNYVEAVNEDITSTGNAVGSVRANCGITNVIAVIIKKLFGI